MRVRRLWSIGWQRSVVLDSHLLVAIRERGVGEPLSLGRGGTFRDFRATSPQASGVLACQRGVVLLDRVLLSSSTRDQAGVDFDVGIFTHEMDAAVEPHFLDSGQMKAERFVVVGAIDRARSGTTQAVVSESMKRDIVTRVRPGTA